MIVPIENESDHKLNYVHLDQTQYHAKALELDF